MINRFIIKNSIITPDGTELISHHRYDKVVHEDKISGNHYAIHGGNKKLLRIGKKDYTENSVWSDNTFEVLRENHHIKYIEGDNYKHPRYILLKDAESQIIAYAIQRNFKHFPLTLKNIYFINLYLKELKNKKW